MVPDLNPAEADWEVIARNVRGGRKAQGLSQTELAQRSGVDLASVYRVERGKVVRTGTLKKIAEGLRVMVEDFMIDSFKPRPENELAVHRRSDARWYGPIDRRRLSPPDKDDLNQDERERARLGKLGLVPWFMCPPLIIPPNGPGIVLLEVFGANLEGFNSEFYEDGALYVLRGDIHVHVGERSAALSEGDWVAFRTEELSKIEVLPPSESALVMWIGATRRRRPGRGRAART